MANTSGRDRQTLTFERQQEFWASGFRGAGWQSERFVEGMANYDRVLRPFVNQIQGEVNPRLLRLGLPMAQRAIDVFRATTALACFLHLPTWPRAFPRRTAVATGSSPRIRYRPAPHEATARFTPLGRTRFDGIRPGAGTTLTPCRPARHQKSGAIWQFTATGG